MLRTFNAFCRDGLTMISGGHNTTSPTTNCTNGFSSNIKKWCKMMQDVRSVWHIASNASIHRRKDWRLGRPWKAQGPGWSLRDGQHFQKSWASQWCFLPMDSDPRNLRWHLTHLTSSRATTAQHGAGASWILECPVHDLGCHSHNQNALKSRHVKICQNQNLKMQSRVISSHLLGTMTIVHFFRKSLIFELNILATGTEISDNALPYEVVEMNLRATAKLLPASHSAEMTKWKIRLQKKTERMIMDDWSTHRPPSLE